MVNALKLEQLKQLNSATPFPMNSLDAMIEKNNDLSLKRSRDKIYL